MLTAVAVTAVDLAQGPAELRERRTVKPSTRLEAVSTSRNPVYDVATPEEKMLPASQTVEQPHPAVGMSAPGTAAPGTASEPVLPRTCLQEAHVICVSKEESTLRYLESGHTLMTVPVRCGRPGYETPSGTFTVKAKDAKVRPHPLQTQQPWSLTYDANKGRRVHWSEEWNRDGDAYPGSRGGITIKGWKTARSLFQRAPLGTIVHIY